jgi:DNA repair protein RecO (recombination protein O)
MEQKQLSASWPSSNKSRAMIQKTRGIVFRFTKFRETSIIVTIFTEKFGVQSYIVNGVRSKKASNKIALYQPLTLLTLVVYHREQANIERIKEAQCLYPYDTLLTDIKKSTVAMFLTELLNKTVKEEVHSGDLFTFICDSFIAFDKLQHDFENFHLLFMMKLARYLGFGVQNVNEVLGGRVTDEKTEKTITRLITASYGDAIPMDNQQRREILDLLVKFYIEHMGQLKELKSLVVLREVIS